MTSSETQHRFTNGGGSSIAQIYTYDPYGRLLTTMPGATLDQPFRWNNEYGINDFDYKIGTRYYDTSQARWTQTDQ
jgi:hypothetical protein